jgi:hypothetical protein
VTNGDRPKRRRARAETRQAIEAAAIEAATRLTAQADQGDLARRAADQPPRATAAPQTAAADSAADDAADAAADDAAQDTSPAGLAARAAAIQQEIMRQYRNR